MINIELRNATTAGEVLNFGVPFAKGALKDPNLISLHIDEQLVKIEKRVTANWQDGSVKWLHIQLTLPNFKKQLTNLSLRINQSAQYPMPNDYSVGECKDFIKIFSANIEFKICKKTAQLEVSSKEHPEQKWLTSYELSKEQPLKNLIVNEIKLEPTELYPRILLKGHYGNVKKITLQLVYSFFDNGLVNIEVQLHNSARAKHKNGLWDLGDTASLLFSKFTVSIKGCMAQRLLQTNIDEDWLNISTEDGVLEQNSSGGEHWDSLNHVNKDGYCSTNYRGFKLHSPQQNYSGLRAEPLMVMKGATNLEIALPKFWQKFPQSLDWSAEQLNLNLFAEQKTGLHELQPGEKSTRHIWLHFKQPMPGNHQEETSLRWVYKPTEIVLPLAYLEQCQIMPHLNVVEADPLRSCLHDPEIFFEKREIIDEYGWRNFGDIFADHETLYQKADETPYISHYNNQYDAIYGFCRQYLLTGNNKWFQLMDDLARHVIDIDIYDTEDDREEYNHGLFWHTEHYIPAQTATHRTYSKKNINAVRFDSFGGGPGSEHCYTTGLCYHYWLTGNETSKETVVKLADWMINLHEGTDCLLSQLWRLKSVELKRLIKRIKNARSDIYEYPFTRGTGNYINALLDAFLISNSKTYLLHAEQVIRKTFGPDDEIHARELLDVERNWSYVIFLASVARYLDIKHSLNAFDDSFNYAKCSLLHYAEWMVRNEKPYLSEQDKLDHPNDTWIAQDIRKSMLLFTATSYAETDEQKERLQNTANNWHNDTVQKLTKSDSLSYSRLQIILLQTYGPHLENVNAIHYPERSIKRFTKMANTSLSYEVKDFIQKLASATLKFNLQKEWHWLKNRLK